MTDARKNGHAPAPLPLNAGLVETAIRRHVDHTLHLRRAGRTGHSRLRPVVRRRLARAAGSYAPPVPDASRGCRWAAHSGRACAVRAWPGDGAAAGYRSLDAVVLLPLLGAAHRRAAPDPRHVREAVA